MDITEQLNKIESDERELLWLYRELSEDERKILFNDLVKLVNS